MASFLRDEAKGRVRFSDLIVSTLYTIPTHSILLTMIYTTYRQNRSLRSFINIFIPNDTSQLTDSLQTVTCFMFLTSSPLLWQGLPFWSWSDQVKNQKGACIWAKGNTNIWKIVTHCTSAFVFDYCEHYCSYFQKLHGTHMFYLADPVVFKEKRRSVTKAVHVVGTSEPSSQSWLSSFPVRQVLCFCSEAHSWLLIWVLAWSDVLN